jgi:hypothetical protein
MQRNIAPKHNVNVVIPRAGRVPSMQLLNDVVLFHHVPSAECSQVIRANHIATLIADELATA